jgi:LDH2 family malate/lactate/ureidoglycolate dehydrogenase
MGHVVVPAVEHRALIVAVLTALGIPETEADEQAELLHEADLRGVHSHGIQRLPVIAARIRNGVAVGDANITLTWRAQSILAVDGARGLGPVVINRALEATKLRARDTGAAVALVSNANHIGMLSHYAERLAEEGWILIAVTTSEALVHPYGGRDALLGTNPIAVGIPSDDGPFVLDMSTAATSMGRVLEYAARNEPLPAGWAVDAEGAPTTDPHAVRDGAISPFGGVKGYALALAVELLVGSLTDASMGDAVSGTLDGHTVCNKGDVLICIDGATAGAGHRAKLTAFLQELRASRTAVGATRVRVPGDRARGLRAQRLRDGIPLAGPVWDEVAALRATAVV